MSGYLTLHVQPDSLAEFPHPVLDLTPVVALVPLLHLPDDQRPVGMELCLAAGRLDVVEYAGLTPCSERYIKIEVTKIFSQETETILSFLVRILVSQLSNVVKDSVNKS